MNGRVHPSDPWLMSEDGKGVPPPRSSLPPIPDEHARTAGRILVVEDDYFVGLISEAALIDAGYEVLAVVTTAEEAIQMAVSERPDLVLMDVRLAGELDGVDAAIALAGRGIRSLFATAHSDPQTRKRGERAHPAGWLTKPFSGTELCATVARALAGGRST